MKIAVTSPSFSKNKNLQNEIYKYFKDVVLNLEGVRFNQDELIEYIKNADAVIVGLDPINSDVLNKSLNLKIIAKYGVGLNNIDLEACRKRNVIVGWSGGVNKLSVAEMALGFMLMFARNLFVSSNELKNGIWNKSAGFQLSGKTIGIIGIGHTGKELVRLLKPFDCKIFVNDIMNQEQYCEENKLENTTKEKIFKTCDFVTINTPHNDATNNMVDAKVLNSMKNTAYILNIARGGIINETDLKYALKNNIIAGAAIDAYVEEPPTDQEFLKLSNLICTPHIGGNAKEAVEAMGMSAIEHLKKYYNL
jgi:phosphoglycerate dehydrogenase-like enzyme